MIFQTHTDSLKSRAIYKETAQAAGITSATAQELAAVMGLNSAKSGGMLIPYRAANGSPIQGEDGLDIVRARVDQGEPKYLSRAGAGWSIYMEAALRKQLTTGSGDEKMAAEFIVITEGEFKAIAVGQALDIPAIGLPGVSMYLDPARDKSDPVTSETPLHPLLADVVSRSNGVLVIADSDASYKPQVRQAMVALKEAISKQFKIPCAYLEVPGPKKSKGAPKKTDATEAGVATAKKPEAVVPKTGVDDWLAAVGGAGHESVKGYLRKVFYAEKDRLIALKEGGYTPLGYSIDETTGAGAYYVFSTMKNAVIRISSGQLTNVDQLIHAASLSWLLARHPKVSDKGSVSVDNVAAGGELARACTEAGSWTDERRVGSGVWPIADDQTALLVNSSAGLWATDGRAVGRVSADGGVYVASTDLGVTPATEQATRLDAQIALEAMRTFRWSNAKDAGLAMAWVAAAYYCGGLEQRPMLYLTGKKGSGKSTLMDFMRTLLGPFALGVQEGTGVTEPALRRMLGRSSLVTLIDEAEATDNPDRMRQVIAFVRSSYRGGKITKASGQGGGVDTYTVRTMAALGAINPMHLDESEQSRFVMLQLMPRPADMPSHELLSSPAEARALGLRLGSRMLQNWPRFRDAMEISKALLDGTSQRYRDTIGTVVAAGFVLLNDGAPTVESVATYMQTLDIDNQKARIVDTPTDATPLEWLLDKVVAIDVEGHSRRVSLREVVADAASELNANKSPSNDALGRYGLRVGTSERGELALLADLARGELVELFKSSRWAAQQLSEAFRTQVPSCEKKQESKTWSIGQKKVKPLAMGISELVDVEAFKPAGQSRLAAQYESAYVQ